MARLVLVDVLTWRKGDLLASDSLRQSLKEKNREIMRWMEVGVMEGDTSAADGRKELRGSGLL